MCKKRGRERERLVNHKSDPLLMRRDHRASSAPPPPRPPLIGPASTPHTRAQTPPPTLSHMAGQAALNAVPVPEANVLADALESSTLAHLPSRKVAKNVATCFKRIKDGVDAVHDCWRRMGERNQVCGPGGGEGAMGRRYSDGMSACPLLPPPPSTHPAKPRSLLAPAAQRTLRLSSSTGLSIGLWWEWCVGGGAGETPPPAARTKRTRDTHTEDPPPLTLAPNPRPHPHPPHHTHQTDTHFVKWRGELKKEIKRLQRQRDLVRAWADDPTIQDPAGVLDDSRRAVEVEMERMRAYEREARVKDYSRESLARTAAHPADEAKAATVRWVRAAQASLVVQAEQLTADADAARAAGRASAAASASARADDHASHVARLDQVMRAVENETLAVGDVDELLKEAVEDYVARGSDVNAPPLEDCVYDGCGLDALESVGTLAAHGGPGERADRAAAAAAAVAAALEGSDDDDDASGPRAPPSRSAAAAEKAAKKAAKKAAADAAAAAARAARSKRAGLGVAVAVTTEGVSARAPPPGARTPALSPVPTPVPTPARPTSSALSSAAPTPARPVAPASPPRPPDDVIVTPAASPQAPSLLPSPGMGYAEASARASRTPTLSSVGDGGEAVPASSAPPPLSARASSAGSVAARGAVSPAPPPARVDRKVRREREREIVFLFFFFFLSTTHPPLSFTQSRSAADLAAPPGFSPAGMEGDEADGYNPYSAALEASEASPPPRESPPPPPRRPPPAVAPAPDPAVAVYNEILLTSAAGNMWVDVWGGEGGEEVAGANASAPPLFGGTGGAGDAFWERYFGALKATTSY